MTDRSDCLNMCRVPGDPCPRNAGVGVKRDLTVEEIDDLFGAEIGLFDHQIVTAVR
jgi:hypothetical protein